MDKKIYPLGGKYENMEYVRKPGEGTEVYIEQNWPEPEIKGHGVVKTKDGVIKRDGGNT